MTVDTQKLLYLFDAAAQAHGWAAYQGTREHAQTALTNYQKARKDLEQALDAQAAEIARLNAIQAWQPIETAPRDGTAILLGSSDGAWIAKYDPVYPSGYRPKNPWFSLMLNHDHMGRMPNTKPTHWMPLPAAPDALSGESHD